MAVEDEPARLLAEARLQMQQRLPGLAIETYRRALNIRPSPEAAFELAEILLRESHPEQALQVLQTVGVIPREAWRAQSLVARAFTLAGRFEEAQRHWLLAEHAAPNAADVFHGRATVEAAMGRFQVAETLLEDCLRHNLDMAGSFYLYTSIRRMTESDSVLLERMRSLARSGTPPPSSAARIYFGLGKSFDDLQDFEQAIGFFDEANRISYAESARRRTYNPEETRLFTDFLVEHFTETRINDLSRRSSESDLPLFVVGMLRSGTTLVENILGSHSHIKPGGEQMFWTQRAIEFFRWTPGGLSCDYEGALKLVPSYLRLVDPREQGIRYVVDKNPTNIHLAALLHSMFPRAKFVHIVRHPVDNLLSMWMTPFNEDLAYASNRENLISFYKEYLRLVRHLSNVIPQDSFSTYRYEDLTSTPQDVIPRMLSHVGLSTETACFEPERSRRAVLTPSVYQVRQPIHKGSQQRWKRYEPWLGPFRELLAEEFSVYSPNSSPNAPSHG